MLSHTNYEAESMSKIPGLDTRLSLEPERVSLEPKRVSWKPKWINLEPKRVSLESDVILEPEVSL